MAIEIERKFLVRDDSWRADVFRSIAIRQGYLARTPLLRARIRLFGDQGFITLKSEPGHLVRHEYEYQIPKGDAEEIIRRFSIEPLIVKTRHDVMYQGVLWSVDAFAGANAGLVVAEVELGDEDQTVAIPPWVGREVTSDHRYGNSNLARNPFVTWEATEA